jgi:chemotaxis protein methyltransferase CheR
VLIRTAMDLAHVSFCGVEPEGARSRFAAKTGAAPRWRPPPAAEPEPLDPLAVWMLEQAGVDPAAYRPRPIGRRLPACLRRLRTESAEAARRLLGCAPELLPLALDSMLIGVTEFFRDRAVFDYLRASVLPELLGMRHGIRVYAAGVSAGQELYSVAMLLDEMGALNQSELLGVDLRHDAIARARFGCFSASELATLTEVRRARYFRTRQGDRWAACERLRQRIDWRRSDLMSFRTPESQQLILFRNVAIYLQPQAAALAWATLCSQLEPGGFLVSGKAEQPPDALPLVRVAASIYRKP